MIEEIKKEIWKIREKTFLGIEVLEQEYLIDKVEELEKNTE
jgi:hypothetical protein